MKISLARALVVAAALALSIPAFAQLSVNGYYRAGAASNIDGNGSGQFALMDRIRLNLSFAAPDDMAGFKARLQADSSTQSALVNLFADKYAVIAPKGGDDAVMAPLYSLKYGQGYVKLLDGVVKLTAGRLDIGDYNVQQNVGNIYGGNIATDEIAAKGSLLGNQTGNFTGAILQVWPIEGLSVAIHAKTDVQTNVGYHNFGLDAYYMMPGIGKAIFSSQALDDTDLSKLYASVGYSYTGFKGLTATAVYRYISAPSASNYGIAPKGTTSSGAVAVVEYSSGPLFADVAGDFDFTNSAYYMEGEVSYLVIPQLKVRGYGIIADSLTSLELGASPTTYFTSSFSSNGGKVLRKTNNQYIGGLDVIMPVGKSEISVGIALSDQDNVQIPILAKVNF
jgi:hypothetical protein